MTRTRILLTSLLVLTLLTGVWAAKNQASLSPSGMKEAVPPSEPEVQPLSDVVLVQPETRPGLSGTAATFEIPWQSINGGGNPSTSASYILNASAGQSTIGFATSTSYQAGIGYWYGAGAATGGGCSCPFQSDFDADGFLTALDLAAMIDILFAGSPDLQDPDCPSPRADFDCDGFSTALDLGFLIDHLFAGGAGPCDPCNP